jgi:hypothetical protein
MTEAEIEAIIKDGVPRVYIDEFQEVEDGKKYKGQWYHQDIIFTLSVGASIPSREMGWECSCGLMDPSMKACGKMAKATEWAG